MKLHYMYIHGDPHTIRTNVTWNGFDLHCRLATTNCDTILSLIVLSDFSIQASGDNAVEENDTTNNTNHSQQPSFLLRISCSSIDPVGAKVKRLALSTAAGFMRRDTGRTTEVHYHSIRTCRYVVESVARQYCTANTQMFVCGTLGSQYSHSTMRITL